MGDAKEPLDLCAIETQHSPKCASQEQRYGTSEEGEVYPLATHFPCDCWPWKLSALLTHCRALRAVLQEIVDIADSHGEVSTGELDDATRVLAEATDQE